VWKASQYDDQHSRHTIADVLYDLLIYVKMYDIEQAGEQWYKKGVRVCRKKGLSKGLLIELDAGSQILNDMAPSAKSLHDCPSEHLELGLLGM